tara:strand:+ start:695 stop:901 length:207 start_codon:yes stop_codon:yes gene_type:complete
MKSSNWILYLYDDEEKKQILKIMEFKTIKELGSVLDMDPQIVSNWFHGLINPRGILKSCLLLQSVSVN